MDRLTRFNDAKFGLFVHWGAYSVAGLEASWPAMLGPELGRRFAAFGEAIGIPYLGDWFRTPITYDEYLALGDRFEAQRFDAAQWAELARDAGQRYMVLTTKHHDGFCLFDSAHTEHKVTNTPFGRDVVGELAAACGHAGVAFGAYYSCPDLVHPGYRDQSKPPPDNFLGEPDREEWESYIAYMEAQTTELLTRYGDLFALWWDVGHDPAFPTQRLHEHVRRTAPGTLMNDRAGGLELDGDLRADYLTPEQSIPSAIPRRSRTPSVPDMRPVFDMLRQDGWRQTIDAVAPGLKAAIEAAQTPDPSLPEPGDFQPWEACMTFGGRWAYDPDGGASKDGPTLIRDLVEVASRGGNLLMNVGPSPDGTIPEPFQDALRDVGRWLERNGESIYGTTYGPVQGVDGIRTTARDGAVYVHVLGTPGGPVRVPLDEEVVSAAVLGDGRPVDVVRDGPGVVFDLATPEPTVSVVELRLR